MDLSIAKRLDLAKIRRKFKFRRMHSGVQMRKIRGTLGILRNEQAAPNF